MISKPYFQSWLGDTTQHNWYIFVNARAWNCCILCFSSLRPSEAHTHHLNISTLLQIMAFRLFGAKPLSETMRPYCQLDPEEHISINFIQISKFSFKEIHSKLSSAKVAAIFPGFNVLTLHLLEYSSTTVSISWVLMPGPITSQDRWFHMFHEEPFLLPASSHRRAGDGGGRPSSVMSLGVASVGGPSHGHPASPIVVGSLWKDTDPRSPEPLDVRGGWLWLIGVVRWTT